MPIFLLALHVATDVAVGLLALVLARRGGRFAVAPLSGARVLMAGVATAAASVLGIQGARAFDLNLFGIIHLLFVDALITAPVLGIALLWRSRDVGASTWARRLAAVAGGLLVAGGACAAYGHYVEPFRLQLETPTVRAGNLGRPVRIGILADLQTDHVTDYERRAVDLLMAQAPDLILIPGDLFQGSPERFAGEVEPLNELLHKLDAPLGVYAVMGNSDRPRLFRRAIAGTRIVWLHNDLFVVPTAAGDIILGGVTYTEHPGVRRIYDVVARDAGPGKLAVLMAHDPGVVYGLGRDEAPDLVVAGHTHGGQVRLPFIGALLTLSRLPARYAAGLHALDGSWFYVSRGVGVERYQAPRVRFLCRPEVTLLTVEPAAPRRR